MLFSVEETDEEDVASVDSSPKRPIAEDSDEEIVGEPPVKRGREKAGKRAAMPKKNRTAKGEPDNMG